MDFLSESTKTARSLELMPSATASHTHRTLPARVIASIVFMPQWCAAFEPSPQFGNLLCRAGRGVCRSKIMLALRGKPGVAAVADNGFENVFATSLFESHRSFLRRPRQRGRILIAGTGPYGL